MPLYLHYSDYLYFHCEGKLAEESEAPKKERERKINVGSEIFGKSFFFPSSLRQYISYPAYPNKRRKSNAEGSLEEFIRKLIFFFVRLGNDVRVC